MLAYETLQLRAGRELTRGRLRWRRGISFEAVGAGDPVHPDRMDVACFVGFIAERPGALLPASLIDWLVRRRLASAEALRDPGRSDRLLNRPVPIESLQALQSLFAPELRLDSQAEVASAALPSPWRWRTASPTCISTSTARPMRSRSIRGLDAEGVRAAIDASPAPVTALLGGQPGAGGIW